MQDARQPELPPIDRQNAARAVEFRQAHARLAAWVMRMLIDRTNDPNTAADLSQRVWIAVWSAVSSGRYDPARSAMSTFVHAVTGNILRQWGRERSRQPAALASTEPATGPDEEEAIQNAEQIERVRAVLGDQPPGSWLDADDRVILRLIARGCTDRELAEELAVAPSTANSRKRAALDKLRQYLLQSTNPPERGGQPREQPDRGHRHA